MTKNEIVKIIANRTGVTHDIVKTIVEEYADQIINCLATGEDYFQRGFGTFAAVKQQEKYGRNICKGTSIIIPACTRPKFKPCNYFVERVKSN